MKSVFEKERSTPWESQRRGRFLERKSTGRKPFARNQPANKRENISRIGDILHLGGTASIAMDESALGI